jgi:hypothetical protein
VINGRQDWRNKILGLPDAEMEASEYERISLLKDEKLRKIYYEHLEVSFNVKFTKHCKC